jgi:predicted Zn-dependent protease
MRAWILACVLVGCAAPKPAGVERTPAQVEHDAPKHLEIDRTPLAAGAAPAPVLSAMRAELDRSMTELRAHGDPAPYYAAYEIVDRREVDIGAEFGALLGASDRRTRSLDVDVRVGDHKLDSSHPRREEDQFARFARRWGKSNDVPIEDDEAALRAALWLATDARYKDATEDLVKVRSERAIDVREDDTSDDFSEDSPASFVGPPAALDLDQPAWDKRVRSLSEVFRAHPELVEAKADLRVSAETRYVVTSEGASLQRGATHARVMFSVQTRADDGMDVQLSDWIDASGVARLPDEATLRARVQALVDRVLALRAAPVADPYVGPAILDGKAAGVFFHETFGHHVEGHRQKDDLQGQTFAKKIGEHVMPDFIDVWDDPTVRALNGVELNGAYPFDDEGIAAQRASLVEQGILKGFLMSRSPARGFLHSNGHGRRSPGSDIVARQANLVVDPARVVTPEDLKRRLLDEVKKQGKPYGLRFAEVEGGYTNTSRSAIQAFKVKPVVVFRVYPDGREELVRGVDLEGTPLTSLSTILAAGNDFAVFNGYCGAESGWVPVTAVSPSLLLGQLEIAHKQKGHDRPPVLPPPTFPRGTTEGGAR